jgi:16S rRNA (uracil1498-N3)-methyltransferase
VERTDRTSVATFFVADEPLFPGALVTLGEDVARHARALRLASLNNLTLVDGAGHRADAAIVRLTRDTMQVQVGTVFEVPPPPPTHLLTPVADRDRLLWLAEKSVELGVSSWRPVRWRRSQSVAPKGEGSAFARRLRARMVAALEQSIGAWLPQIFPEATLERALAAVPAGARVVLDPTGIPLVDVAANGPVTLALGPEGGLEADELETLEQAHFVRASLGVGVLRFETAGIAALAVIRVTRQSRQKILHDA